MDPSTEIVLQSTDDLLPDELPAIRALPFSFAKRHGVLIRDVVDGRADTIYRTGASPLCLAEARRFAGVPLKLTRVSADAFDAILQQSYEQGSNKAMQMAGDLDGQTDLLQVAQELPEPSDLLESDDDAPIIRFINAVLTEAVKENASDVHIEPYENRLVVRFRIDGVLRTALTLPLFMHQAVVSRIKVLANMDIAEKRALGLLTPGEAADADAERLASKRALAAAIDRADPAPGTTLDAEAPHDAAITAAIHRYACASQSALVLVQADDLAGETVALNLPGTDLARPNWRRKVRVEVAGLWETPSGRQAVADFAGARTDE